MRLRRLQAGYGYPWLVRPQFVRAFLSGRLRVRVRPKHEALRRLGTVFWDISPGMAFAESVEAMPLGKTYLNANAPSVPIGALLNHDAALVQQFARLGEHGEQVAPRSEERRVGKECRSRWSPYH